MANKKATDTMRESFAARASFVQGVDRLVDTLQKNPYLLAKDLNQLGSRAASLVDSLTGLRQAWLGNDPEKLAESLAVEGRTDAMIRNSDAFKGMMQVGWDAATARAQILSLAYTFAKTLDPGGRLSDKDVEMAVQMLSGDGSPQSIRDILSIRLEEIDYDLFSIKNFIDSYGDKYPNLVKDYNDYSNLKAKTMAKFDNWVLPEDKQYEEKTDTNAPANKVQFTITPKR